MRVWTFGEARAKISNDMDLANETFLTADEMVGLFNDSIQVAASHIYKLGVEDDYFTKSVPFPTVSGQSLYSLPSDIFNNKIRGMTFHSGDEIYTIYHLRRRNKFVKIEEINQYAQDVYYQYDLINSDVNTGVQLKMVPPSRETSPSIITINYIREAAYIPLVSTGSQAVSDAAKIDLPQFMTFVFADVKLNIARKIPHPNLADFEARQLEQLTLMINTLTEMIVDDATEVEPDLVHYWRHS